MGCSVASTCEIDGLEEPHEACHGLVPKFGAVSRRRGGSWVVVSGVISP